jgi:uncharacterized membrane protein
MHRELKTMNLSGRTFGLVAVYTVAVASALANVALPGPSLVIPSTLWIMAVIGLTSWHITFRLTSKSVGALGAILALVFLSLASGVNTGFPFGDFAFTNLAGPKVWDVPVVIPFAWLAILIPAWIASDRILHYQHLVVASLIVIAVDAVLEFAVDTMDLWHWRGGTPTELTFISWFGVAYLTLSIAKNYAAPKEANAIVPHFLFAQLAYFFLTDIGMRFIFPHH